MLPGKQDALSTSPAASRERAEGRRTPSRPETSGFGTGAGETTDGRAADTLRTHREQSMLAAVAQFLRALLVLLRSARLYPSQHPRYQESLAAAERELRAAHEWVEPVEVSVEAGALIGEGAMQHRNLGESKSASRGATRTSRIQEAAGEMAALADEFARRNIVSITFQRCTHLGELSTLAALFNSAPADSDWPALFAQYRIQGILLNAPREEKKAESLVSGLVANVLVPELPKLLEAAMAANATSGQPAATSSKPAHPEECLGALRLLVRIVNPLHGTPQFDAPEIAASLGRTLAESDRREVSALVAAMTRQPPQPGEALEGYCARLAQSLVLDFCIEHHRDNTSFDVREVRAFLERAGQELNAPRPAGASSAPLDPRWQEEAFLEYLYELFWAALAPREKLEVLRGPQAWCAPPPALRHHLQEVAKPEEARSIVMQYARALSLPEAKARLATASGLIDLSSVIDHLWPVEFPPDLIRLVTQALIVERAPEVGGVLTALTDLLATLALRKGDFAAYERILEALESENREHLMRLRERLLSPDRWQVMVESALANGSGESGLTRLLGRQPERLLDDLGARLVPNRNGEAQVAEFAKQSGAAGLARLPQMARLVQAIGEPAVGALVTRLQDPRTQRATTAAKLLMAWPQGAQRLLEVLPRALPNWDWNLQDMVVAEIARQKVPGSAATLLEALPHTHPLVLPMILDQIGLGGGAEAAPTLMEIAAGENERFKEVFVRIKAVEALGRLGTRELPPARRAESADLLRIILRQRNGLTHVEPAGVRAAAEEALALLENHPASARVRTAYQAVAKASVSFQQPRRYLRIPLESPLRAQIARHAPGGSLATSRHLGGASAAELLRQRAGEGSHRGPVRVRTISLGGAFLETGQRLEIGDSVQVQIQAGLRRIQGMAVVRNVTPMGSGVEFVHMNQDDREKLRRLVNRLVRSG